MRYTRCMCRCGSGRPSFWRYDARGIELCRTCDDCHDDRMKQYRPEVLNDPNYAASCPSTGNCDALGLRILNSQNLFIYGAGLYSFFNQYNTTCSNAGGPEDCQSQIFSIEGGAGSNNLWVYGLNTIGSQSMVDIDGTSFASFRDNINNFPSTIPYFTYRTG